MNEISISHDTAINAEGACKIAAEKYRREAKKRGNGGPHLKSHRAWLREMADTFERDGHRIRAAIDRYNAS